mgnify:CR=1 FL=1
MIHAMILTKRVFCGILICLIWGVIYNQQGGSMEHALWPMLFWGALAFAALLSKSHPVTIRVTHGNKSNLKN